MRTVQNMLSKAEKIDVSYLVQLSLIDSQEEYVRIQQEQMMSGQRSDGHPIFNLKTGSKEYSRSYAKYKGKNSPIDLRDKGDFQKGIFIHVEDPAVAIVDSSDSKSGKLQENYGTQIFGLNTESKTEFIPIAQANLILEFEKQLG